MVKKKKKNKPMASMPEGSIGSFVRCFEQQRAFKQSEK